MNPIIQKTLEWGHHVDDSKEEKLKKSSLLVVSGPFALAGLIWGILYYSHGMIVPGSIPFGYGLLSISNILVFGYTKRYKFFRNSQLFLILILPFALQMSLGGFVPSSAVMYWAIIAPAGAMFFDSIRRSVYWFIAYLILVVLAYLINDYIPNYVNWDISEVFINRLFLMNIIGVSCIVFGILYYFVSRITDLNRDIEEKNLELQQMDKIKSQFFANISHEFRTPLTLILGLAKKHLSNSKHPSDIRDFRTIQRNANRLLQLINQLLDLSKLESGESNLQASKDDIVDFVKMISSQYESMAADKNISLHFNGKKINDVKKQTKFTPVELYFDHDKLNKIVNNLLSNAIKFTPPEGMVWIEVGAENESSENPEVSIKVINTGDEIPEDKLSHIFDRFFQVDAATNRKYEGTGIGLALVKELVELHHGTVDVQSRMGKTTFIVKLPIDDSYLSDKDILLEESADTETEPPYMHLVEKKESDEEQDIQKKDKLTVLLVEDNFDLRGFIKQTLEPIYNVVEAVDGNEGVEKAINLIPDLIISDVMMPNMDGYQLCDKIKSDRNTDHIPIILLTAKASRKNKLEGLETGADDYLIKPFDELELKVRIKNLIANREKIQRKFQNEMKFKPNEVKITSRNQKFIEEIKNVVEKNIDNELFGVDDLAGEIGMSRSQLYRKLKALTNESVSSFVRNYKLYRAADLITQNAGNITEIAYMVGFNSQTYFSTCFQELFGYTPSEYKKRH